MSNLLNIIYPCIFVSFVSYFFIKELIDLSIISDIEYINKEQYINENNKSILDNIDMCHF